MSKYVATGCMSGVVSDSPFPDRRPVAGDVLGTGGCHSFLVDEVVTSGTDEAPSRMIDGLGLGGAGCGLVKDVVV